MYYVWGIILKFKLLNAIIYVIKLNASLYTFIFNYFILEELLILGYNVSIKSVEHQIFIFEDIRLLHSHSYLY